MIKRREIIKRAKEKCEKKKRNIKQGKKRNMKGKTEI